MLSGLRLLQRFEDYNSAILVVFSTLTYTLNTLFCFLQQKKYNLIHEQLNIFPEPSLSNTHQFIHIGLFSTPSYFNSSVFQDINLITYGEYNQIRHQM